MDPITMAIVGGVSAIFSLFGRLVAQGDIDKANELKERAAARYGDSILPQLEQQVARQQGSTEFGNIQEDPSLRDASMRALQGLEDEYSQGGMTGADRAAMQLAESNAAGRAQSDYQSAANAMAARGQSNNPALMAALQSQVGASSAHAVGQMEAQSQIAARRRALQALEGMGSMSRGIRGDDYRISGDTAAAQDRINQYNTGLMTGADQHNLGIAQQGFENRMNLYGARGNAENGLAQQYMASAGATQNTFSNLAGATLDYGMGASGGKKEPKP